MTYIIDRTVKHCCPKNNKLHNFQQLSTANIVSIVNIVNIVNMGVSENSVPLNPMVLLIIIPIKWLAIIGNTNPTFSGPNPHDHSKKAQIPVLVSTFSFALPGRSSPSWIYGARRLWQITDRGLVGLVAPFQGRCVVPRTCSQWQSYPWALGSCNVVKIC